jgi:hypothetical protein
MAFDRRTPRWERDEEVSMRKMIGSLVLIGTVVGVGVRTTQAAPQGPPPPGELAAIAAELPPLPRDEERVSIPLGIDGAWAWRGVREGITVDAPGETLVVSYQVAAGQPAGAALLLRPGSLAGSEVLVVSTSAERMGTVMVSLQDRSGVAYAFPSISVRPGGLREHRLEVADLSYMAPASSAPDHGNFDLAEVVMISVIDLAGFMGGAEGPMRFEIGTMDFELAPQQAPRAAAALGAEDHFFRVFNHGKWSEREAPLRDLMIAWLADPTDARTALLLGLEHLWLAAEGDRANPRIVEHLLLAEDFLARAQSLDPEDRRIPSWLVPTRLALADLERHPERREALVGELLVEFAQDPAFHSFSVAMLGFDEPRDDAEFERGLQALRSVDSDCGDDDPTCRNTPRWPHNVEAYLTFFADYELKAGAIERARQLLLEAQASSSFSRWPRAAEVGDRLQNLEHYARLYQDEDPRNDPPSILSGARGACGSCHWAG